MKMFSKLLIFSVSTLLLAIPAEASATKTFLDMRIPASACRPIDADKAKVKLSDGAWVFESGQSATATLFCPLHFAYPTDVVDSNQMATFRLWYKDPDGTGTNSRVSATVLRRKYDAASDSALSGASLSSNTYSDTVYQRVVATVNHVIDHLYSYHVEVQMHRAGSGIATPVFVGVDFTEAIT